MREGRSLAFGFWLLACMHPLRIRGWLVIPSNLTHVIDKCLVAKVGHQYLLFRRLPATMMAAPARMRRRDESRKMLWSLRWVG